MAESSSFAVAANIFTSPAEAFGQIKENPKVWLPLLVLLLAQCAASFAYTSSVDLGWLIETQIESQNPDMTQEQREQAISAAANLSPGVYGAIGAVSSVVIITIILFLAALYYTVISFSTNDGIKLKQWFAFVWWCSLPAVLGILASIVNILATDARFMPQDEINPLSFANLFSIDLTGASLGQRILLSLDLTTVWAVVLSVLGYQAWTQRSLLKSVVVVLGPLMLIAVIGTLIALI